MLSADNPFFMAASSSVDRMSLIIILIRPPLYRNAAKPSARRFMAEDEKKPNLRLNDVELHNPSEKKPAGSHFVRDT